jgi:hypothetical protein
VEVEPVWLGREATMRPRVVGTRGGEWRRVRGARVFLYTAAVGNVAGRRGPAAATATGEEVFVIIITATNMCQLPVRR